MSAATSTKMRHDLGWRVEAWARYSRLEAEFDQLREQAEKPGTHATKAMEDALARVASHLNEKWWSNPDIVWSELHRLEVRIARAARGDLLRYYAVEARAHLNDPDMKKQCSFLRGPAFTEVEKSARTGDLPAGIEESKLAGQVACVLDHVHAIADRRHADANQRRQRLLAVAGLTVVLSVLVIAAAIWMDDLPFLVGAENFTDVSDAQVALLVALGGLVGGSWGAFPSLVGATRDRYRLHVARAVARLMMGVLAAIIGVSLVGASWVTDLSAPSAPALFAVSIAFGVAQEPISRILEGKITPASSVTEDSGGEPT
ncbi:MAG TPA: hypothetical protein VFJ28_13700 [Marmoricola sp.]|nr:hypothetical protein [Marmoricola sp.]